MINNVGNGKTKIKKYNISKTNALSIVQLMGVDQFLK
jgi:hypothetical protein